MAELDRRAHFAALDQVGMGLKDGINLLIGRHLLTKEHTTTCLIDDAISQPAEVLDLPAQFLNGHVGEPSALARRRTKRVTTRTTSHSNVLSVG